LNNSTPLAGSQALIPFLTGGRSSKVDARPIHEGGTPIGKSFNTDIEGAFTGWAFELIWVEERVALGGGTNFPGVLINLGLDARGALGTVRGSCT